MIQERYGHGSVGLGNKLFVISGHDNSSCEVFDSNSNVFTKTKGLDHSFCIYSTLPLVSVGYQILAFATLGYNQKLYKPETKMLFIYDVLKDQWSLENNKLTSDIEVKCCAKVPVV